MVFFITFVSAGGARSKRVPNELGGLQQLEPYVSGRSILPKFIGGTPEQVYGQLGDLARDFSVNEIMVQDLMTDHQARLRSFELLGGMLAKT